MLLAIDRCHAFWYTVICFERYVQILRNDDWMNGKILMKKYVVAILMAGITLAACGKEGTVPSVGGNDGEGAVLSEVVSDMPSAAAEAVAEERAEERAAESAAESAADPEEARTEEKEPGTIAENMIFSARLKEFSLPEDDEGMVVVVFEFTNVTDETYYKNGEEIVSGGTWDKTISYTKEKWKKMSGIENWIHYVFSEDSRGEKPIFKGGLSFLVAEDLSVTGLYVFEE